jgi:regulator of protease activity HflC (stomatin/prohibitin superfamily)
MALSAEAEAHAAKALREARRQAGLPALIDDEPTLRVIVAVIGSHVERKALGSQTFSNPAINDTSVESPGYPPQSTEQKFLTGAKPSNDDGPEVETSPREAEGG